MEDTIWRLPRLTPNSLGRLCRNCTPFTRIRSFLMLLWCVSALPVLHFRRTLQPFPLTFPSSTAWWHHHGMMQSLTVWWRCWSKCTCRDDIAGANDTVWWRCYMAKERPGCLSADLSARPGWCMRPGILSARPGCLSVLLSVCVVPACALTFPCHSIPMRQQIS